MMVALFGAAWWWKPRPLRRQAFISRSVPSVLSAIEKARAEAFNVECLW